MKKCLKVCQVIHTDLAELKQNTQKRLSVNTECKFLLDMSKMFR